MSKLFTHPMFAIGLAIRLLLVALLAPHAMVDWYLPFLDTSLHTFSTDPWSDWLAQGGSLVAFPYGYAMWLIFLPLTTLAKLLGLAQFTGYAATLLACDIALMWVLTKLLPERHRLLLATYWLSPIVILPTYALGLNDLIPVLLLSLSIYWIREHRFQLAGALCAAALSAKLSMVVALPLVMLYLYNNRPLRQHLMKFVAGAVCVGLLLGLPLFFSQGASQMLLSNPEMQKIYWLSFDVGNGTFIYLVPLVYLLMLYYAWRVQRLNFDLFQSSTGLAFLLIVLMTPASPGWFIWPLPFLVLYQARSGRMAIMLTAALSALYVVNTLLHSVLNLRNGSAFDLRHLLPLPEPLSVNATGLLLTAMVAVGLVLAMRIWRETIQRNDYFRLSRKPFAIGIAGDSGAGKDTYADAITGLFGSHSVVKLSGDDYHLWDRHKPMWQVMTHLNPMANDLEGFSND